MNHIGTGLIDDVTLAQLVQDIGDILTDPDTATSVVWRGAAARAYDPGSGMVAYTEASTTILGWLSDIELDQRDVAQGAQLGDVRLLVRASDFSSAPTTSAQFRANDTDYRVYHVTRGPLSTHYVIRAHRVA